MKAPKIEWKLECGFWALYVNEEYIGLFESHQKWQIVKLIGMLT